MDKLILLGTKGGPAIRQGGAMPTSSFLRLAGRSIVIDCGIGVARALVEAGEDLRALDLIFITHLHSDHVLELGPLIHTAWTTGLARPVSVFGPPGILEYWQGFLASMAFDNAIRVADEGRMPLEELITVIEYSEGQVMNGVLNVSALRVDHPPVRDCFALRFEGAGHSVTFSADTCYFPPLAEFARGTDILVHEAMLPDGLETIIRKTGLGDKLRAHLHASHSTAAQAAQIARDAGARHLVLHHLIPIDDPDFGAQQWVDETSKVWDGKVSLGQDGLVIDLGVG